MKIDAGLMTTDLGGVPARAKEREEAGFDGIVTAEMSGDPFFPLLLAAEHTERIELMTSIAVAFARNPMIVANLSNDLQAFSKGRFILGLGLPDQAAHREALLHGMVEAGRAHARVRSGHACNLGLLVYG